MQLTGDREEAALQALELVADFLIGEAAPIHLQEVASRREGLMDSGEVGVSGVDGDGKGRQAVRVCDILAGQVELALQVLLGDLEIAQSHADVFVPEQLHERRQADAQTEHLSGVGVPQLVKRHAGRAAGSCGSIGQRLTQGQI